MEILIEIIFVLFFGTVGVFLLWLLKGRRKSFGEIFEIHGYTIGILFLLLIAILIGLYRTFFVPI